MNIPKNAVVIFEHHDRDDRDSSDGESYSWYHDFIVYRIPGKKGYGYYDAVPYSEVTLDPNSDEIFVPDVTWERFKRMHLDEDQRQMLGDASPRKKS